MPSWQPHIELYNHVTQEYTNICIILHIYIRMYVLYGLYRMYINVAIG